MKPLTSIAVSPRRRVLRALTAGYGVGRHWLPPLVAALLVGILGMHALASHGTPTAAAAPASSVAATSTTGMPTAHDEAMAAGTSHAGHDHAAATSHPATPATSTTVDPDAAPGHGSGHAMAGMVMLCVVMLAAAALTLLVVLAAALFRPLLPAAFMPAAVRERTFQWVRGAGPPHEWQFSVIRC
ncbi:MAG TPA: hypothetical protein VFR45_12275 [Nocardioides sp.]|nr:hypothetical protein [Nocardioides sp.]